MRRLLKNKCLSYWIMVKREGGKIVKSPACFLGNLGLNVSVKETTGMCLGKRVGNDVTQFLFPNHKE